MPERVEQRLFDPIRIRQPDGGILKCSGDEAALNMRIGLLENWSPLGPGPRKGKVGEVKREKFGEPLAKIVRELVQVRFKQAVNELSI